MRVKRANVALIHYLKFVLDSILTAIACEIKSVEAEQQAKQIKDTSCVSMSSYRSVLQLLIISSYFGLKPEPLNITINTF